MERENDLSVSPPQTPAREPFWKRVPKAVSGHKTRKDVADRFGVTPQTIAYAERMGRIASVTFNQCVYYSNAEVERFAETYKPDPIAQAKRLGQLKKKTEPSVDEIKVGEKASAVLKCLKDGKDLVQTCIETKMSPDFVRRMWAEMRSGFRAKEIEARREAELRLVEQLSKERAARAKQEHRERMWELKRGTR